MAGIRRKRFLWISSSVLCAVLALLAALAFILPRVVNIEGIQKKILAEASKQVKGKVSFNKFDLSVFPYPRLVIHGGVINIPGKTNLHIESLTLVPRLLPLLKRQTELRRVKVSGLKVALHLKKERRKKGPSIQDIERKIRKILTLAASSAPRSKIELEHGEVTLYFKKKKGIAVWIRNLRAQATLPPDKLKIDLAFNSSIGEDLSFKGWLDPKSFDGQFDLHLSRFQPHKLACCLFSLTPKGPVDSMMNLQLALKLHGLRDLKGMFKGSVPCLAVRRNGHKLVMECGDLRGRFHFRDRKIKVVLEDMDLKYPNLHLAGNFLWDPQAPVARLNVTGKNVDIASVREMVLPLAGENHTVQEIFAIIQGGIVPRITFQAHGASLKDLHKLSNMEIKGNITTGRVKVPNDIVKVEDVKGNVTISNGILKGERLTGRVGKSTGSEGILTLGLKGRDAPFHLEINVEGSLSQLPPILKKLVKDRGFLKELSMVKELQGTAWGKLTLGESVKHIKARIEVRNLHLSCSYPRVPYPIRIYGGRFFYHGTRVSVKDLRGTLGLSSFLQLSARIDWSKMIKLQIFSMQGQVSLNQIFPWLLSYKQIKESLNMFKDMSGTIKVKSLNLSGPLVMPEEWVFTLKGELKAFLMDYSLFPASLRISRGDVSLTHKAISFNNCISSLMDASLLASGKLKDYLRGGVNELQLALDGKVGPHAAQWVYKFIDLPPEFRMKAPLSLKEAHITWNKDGHTRFSGDLALMKGPSVSLEVESSPETVEIRKLDVSDDGHMASLTLGLKRRDFRLSFKGTLEKQVLDAILEENRILKGRVQGDFTAHLALDRPAEYEAEGTLKLEDFHYLWNVKMPLNVKLAVLKAHGGKLEVKQAYVGFSDSSFALKGTVDLADDALNVNMDLTSPYLQFEDIESELDFDVESDAHPWRLPLKGIINAKVLSLEYKDLVWRPVEANIYLNPQEVNIKVTQAVLCGISIQGLAKVSSMGTGITMVFNAENRDFDQTLACLFKSEGLIKGTYDFKGKLIAGAKGSKNPLKHSEGEVFLKSQGGRIYRLNILSKILSILNFMEVYRGRLPDLKEGFAYYSIEAKGKLKNGQLLLEEVAIDGSSMKIFAEGKVDLLKMKLNLTVLAAPLKTVDTFLSTIPLLGKVLTGKSKTLLSVPFRVKGPINDPTVVPIPASSLGSGILGIMKRTFQVPVEVIKATVPRSE